MEEQIPVDENIDADVSPSVQSTIADEEEEEIEANEKDVHIASALVRMIY